MADITYDPGDRDPTTLGVALPLVKMLTRLYHRAEVRGAEKIPEGAALVVGNHSGAPMPLDAPLFATAYADRFGVDAPIYLLTADVQLNNPLRPVFERLGLIPASPENARHALTSGAPVMVFPGGDYEAVRPSRDRYVVDFGGRRGFVRTALDAGVPIVPVVTIGGQETHWYLTRGEGLAKALRLDKLARVKVLPLQLGLPFGLSVAGVLPPNVPLPAKLVTQVLDPIDLAEFGDDPDVDVVATEVQRRMQAAMDRLAQERRFPIIG